MVRLANKKNNKRKPGIAINHKQLQPPKKIKSTPKPNHSTDDFVAPTYSPVHLPPPNTVEIFEEEFEEIFNPSAAADTANISNQQAVNQPPSNTAEGNYEEEVPLGDLFNQVSNILTSSSKVQNLLLQSKFS